MRIRINISQWVLASMTMVAALCWSTPVHGAAAVRPPRNVTTFDTASDLEATDWRSIAADGRATVVLRGWGTAGDGRGGLFSLDPSNQLDATNSLDVLGARTNGMLAGRWKRISAGLQVWDGNAVAFGADRSGLSDSAPAINAALDFAFSNRVDRVYLPPGIYSVSTTIVVRPNTLLCGDFAAFTEDASMVAGTTNFKSGASAWLKLADGANCPVVSLSTNGATYLRQQASMYDGIPRNAYYVNSGLRNIGIFGNQGGQTRNDCHGVIANDAWNLLLDSVTVVKVKGQGIQLRNCNAVRVNKCNVVSPTNGRNTLFDDCADITVTDNYFFGASGPVVWLNGPTAWKNQFVGNLLGNSYADTMKEVAISGTNITTSSAHGYETGDIVFFENRGGALPSQIQSNQTCIVIKIDSTSFSIATNWPAVEAGTAMSLSGGSGTNYVYRGKPAGFFLSHRATRNSFTGNRVDQTFYENILIQGGTYNSIVGNELSDAGTFGSPTATTNLIGAVRLDHGAQNNLIMGNIGAASDYALTLSADATQNIYVMNSIFSAVSEFTNAPSVLALNTIIPKTGGWYLPTSSYIGDYALGTVMRMRGGASAGSLLTLDREGHSKIGFNISGQSLRILDETNQTVMVSFDDDASTASMYLGGQGPPKTTRIYGVNPTGTDQAGLPLRLVVGGTGSGSAANANVEVYVPVVGSSGSSAQAVYLAFSVIGSPTGKRTSIRAWDNRTGTLRHVITTNLTVGGHTGDFWVFE